MGMIKTNDDGFIHNATFVIDTPRLSIAEGVTVHIKAGTQITLGAKTYVLEHDVKMERE